MSGRVLGLDLGSRRIGVAVSDGGQRLATGVTAIHRRGDRVRDHRAVDDLVNEYEAVQVVVGLPLSLSGAVGAAAQGALAEVEELRATLSVPVDTWDERFTTVAASAALRRGGRSSRGARTVVDQVAAAVMLQGWLDRRNHTVSDSAG